MGRAPCCEKIGLKKGPWSPDEDNILREYIQKNGHLNWRALPKKAGLLRCGKSCRLRWANYLRPDIKRGHFTREEEETIIQLHGLLGNRWSAIAAKLPGRTDNEIKNVWHTRLKKMLKQSPQATSTETQIMQYPHHEAETPKSAETTHFHAVPVVSYSSSRFSPASPQQSSSSIDSSSVVSEAFAIARESSSRVFKYENNSIFSTEIDVSFWPDQSPFSSAAKDSGGFVEPPPPSPLPPLSAYEFCSSNVDGDGMDFWYEVFMKSGGLQEFPQL